MVLPEIRLLQVKIFITIPNKSQAAPNKMTKKIREMRRKLKWYKSKYIFYTKLGSNRGITDIIHIKINNKITEINPIYHELH